MFWERPCTYQCNFLSGFTGTSGSVAASSHSFVFMTVVVVTWSGSHGETRGTCPALCCCSTNTLPVHHYHSHGLIGSDGSRFLTYSVCVHKCISLCAQRVGEAAVLLPQYPTWPPPSDNRPHFLPVSTTMHIKPPSVHTLVLPHTHTRWWREGVRAGNGGKGGHRHSKKKERGKPIHLSLL